MCVNSLIYIKYLYWRPPSNRFYSLQTCPYRVGRSGLRGNL